MEKINLWNVIHKKMKQTRKYINSLDPRPSFDRKEEARFQNQIKEALSKDESNAMLEHIGFNPLGVDQIYRDAVR